jgi:hypothetical protein
MTSEILKPHIETAGNFVNSLNENQKNFLMGFVKLNREDLMIDWDLDQTLEITENPIKDKVLVDFGKDYRNRNVDGWDSIREWLIADGVAAGVAGPYEESVWVNNDLLMLGEPNKALRALSYLAYLKGIPQSVTTVRAQGLRQTTYRWLDKHFPWIPAGQVNFNLQTGIKGRDYKVNSILKQYDKYPGLVHVDDDLTIMRPLIEAAPRLGLIGIKYPSDEVDSLNHSGNRIFAERQILESVIWTFAR